MQAMVIASWLLSAEAAQDITLRLIVAKCPSQEAVRQVLLIALHTIFVREAHHVRQGVASTDQQISANPRQHQHAIRDIAGILL